MIKKLLIASLLLSATQQANAFLSTESVLDWDEKGGSQASMARLYLGGIAEGFWISSMAGKDRKRATICFPESQDLQTEELRLMAMLSLKKALNKLDTDELKEQKRLLLENPVSMSLQLVWQEEFPCS
ncbi:hypothetical protein DCO48_10605 [Pseudomonas sp. SDI]|uniref:hypothetical protein n=1 Tax=Pseudomonas sp. SDI TaxID=2170734 RepID=UPI000DE6C8FE|nr:hypothetical protein [Pseudomonas sp. SDI]PWB33107.1 hypothetical protein DCO48_10605 [Pseudomonas sp. SDI]